MKYSNEIEIDLSRERVIELFDNADNLSKWQPDLISFEHISGEPGKVGAKSRLKYDMGKKGGKVEMIETIVKNDLPEEFHGTYEAPGVFNQMQNYFTEVSPGKTKWKSDTFFKFSTFKMKLFGFLMPGAFKRQSYKFMENFKSFAEASSE
ncbi:MAG: SRPBCC family protein [Flavobacteriaceae bacterium]|nr:SRPBCC family protein [Flavobacteriaceae bacterium]